MQKSKYHSIYHSLIKTDELSDSSELISILSSYMNVLYIHSSIHHTPEDQIITLKCHEAFMWGHYRWMMHSCAKQRDLFPWCIATKIRTYNDLFSLLWDVFVFRFCLFIRMEICGNSICNYDCEEASIHFDQYGSNDKSTFCKRAVGFLGTIKLLMLLTASKNEPKQSWDKSKCQDNFLNKKHIHANLFVWIPNCVTVTCFSHLSCGSFAVLVLFFCICAQHHAVLYSLPSPLAILACIISSLCPCQTCSYLGEKGGVLLNLNSYLCSLEHPPQETHR